MKMSQRDEIFMRAMKFVKNSQKIHPGVSNIYVFTSVDKDGNITDEKYGMNVMTNTGFSAVYQSGNEFEASSTVKLYVGSGTTPVTIEDTQLENVCFNGLAATNTDTSKDYAYPMYYAAGTNPGDGLITLISRFMVCEYPLNIDNFPGDTRIEEYGIGTAWNNLWTHSRIYSDDGTRTSIVKKQDEKLIITVYMCLSFYEHLIQNGWANDVYTMITTNQIMYHRMFESNIYTYKRDDKVFNRQTYAYSDGYHTIDNTQENVFTNSSICNSFVLYDGAGDDSGYIDGFLYHTPGMCILEPAFLSSPEAVNVINLQSKTPQKHIGFSEKFGMVPSNESDYNKHQWPPITHFNTATGYLYDWKTDGWNVQMSVYNPNNKLYSDTPAQSTCGLPIYYWNGREIVTAYLYQNIRPDDPILSISVGSLSVYATDSYWDFDTWIFIDNFNDIVSKGASQKRFWITSTNVKANDLKFTRQSDVFQLLEPGGSTPADNGFVSYGGLGTVYGIANTCDNYAYKWFLRGNKVYFPESMYVYTVGDSSNTESMTYGKWLITFNSVNNKVFATDTSRQDPTTITSSEQTLPFTGTVNSYSECYRTESGTGIICMQSVKSGVEECVIIDIRGANFVSHKHDWKMSCCIWGTNKVAYVPAGTSDKNVYIYDVTTGAVDGSPIPFPSTITKIPFMFGHSDGVSDYVWCTNGSTYAFVVNVASGSSRTPEAFTNNIPYNSGLSDVRFTSVDDVFIVYKFSEYGSNSIKKAHYIRMDNPTMPQGLDDFEVNNDYLKTRVNYDLRYTYKSTSGGTTRGAIVLSICRGYHVSGNNAGAQIQVIDFGQYLRTSTIMKHYYLQESLNAIIPYGENFIWCEQATGTSPQTLWIKSPIPNWMPIKIVGTTDTPTAMTNIKNITNKQWLLSYTNRPSYGDGTANSRGIPPGKPLAQTDGNGTIIGWSW